jgi:hypothetical protein
MQTATSTKTNGSPFTLDDLKQLSQDAAFVADVMKELGPLCVTAEEAAAKRDECFSSKMKNQEFADRVQRLRDWGSRKRHNDFLMVGETRYTSIKTLLSRELGVSYAFVVRYMDATNKRIHALITDADLMSNPPPNPPPNPSPNLNAGRGTPRPPTVETLAVHGFDASMSVGERVLSAYQSAVDCTETLSATDKYEFYGELIHKLRG